MATLNVKGGTGDNLWLVNEDGVELFRLDLVRVELNQSPGEIASATLHCLLAKKPETVAITNDAGDVLYHNLK